MLVVANKNKIIGVERPLRQHHRMQHNRDRDQRPRHHPVAAG